MRFFINYKYFPPMINDVFVNFDPVSIIVAENTQNDEYIFEALSLYDEFPFINSRTQMETRVNTIMLESFSVFPNKLSYEGEQYPLDDEMISQLWKIKQKWMRMQP
ncbi:hypothetical protein WN59_03185 [Salinicoccus sediminis]|uniref:Uncharacterized protein n=1 Tax=Salinicoccus sediminis TaxID=1432562 RepID=A0A0M2SNN9_9STAP|nr:hypothetical protein [Salinicoccus sediminis]KKK35833.1 hypothetical protein WN59_03185 [Salinicoccus sediminis]